MSIALEPSEIDPDSLTQGARIANIAGPRLRLFALSLPAVIALVIWRVSLLHVDVSNLGDYGLPPALPITWYLGVLLSVIGAVTAITARRTSGLILVVYLVAIAIILFGTVPVLSAQPHYSWVYKHIGVVRYLEAHGKVNPSIDIYNRWPGFFALAAAFSSVAGRPDPETYASWAELFLILLDAVLVMVAVKAITREVRIAAGAALIFILTDWAGETLYSPQAFAFVLGLALIAIMLRQLRVDGTNYSRRLTRWIERVGRVPQLSVQTDTTPKWPRWAAITAVLSLDAVIVASHQLTPYMLLASIALLMVAGVARPWWVLMGMAIMTFAYLGANFNFIQRNYGLFTSIDPFNNVVGVAASKIPGFGTQPPAAGETFHTHAELLSLATLWLGGLCALIRLLRRGLLARSLPFVVLAVSPFTLAFAQSYGGEAPLRIILFSGPWWAALISWALATVARRRLRWLLMVSSAVVFAAFFIPSFFGLEELYIVSAAEVRASEQFYYHARPGSVLLFAALGFPGKYGATYPEFRGPEESEAPTLMTVSSFRNRQLGVAEVPNVISIIKQYAQRGYIAFSKTETGYAELFHLTPPGALGHLEAAVARSPDFRLWYRNNDAQIYEMVVTRVVRRQSANNLHSPSRPPPVPTSRTLQLVQQLASFGKYPFSSQHRHARIPKKSHLVRTTAGLDARHRGRAA